MSRVFVLGAGSTKAVKDSAPLNADLLPWIFKYKHTNFKGSSEAFALIRDVQKLVLDLYPEASSHRPLKDRLPPIEDVLSVLDSTIEMEQNLPLGYELGELRSRRDALVYAICKLLRDRIRRTDRDLMQDFVEQIGREDKIITLNYDLVVDNAVIRSDMRVDYGTSIRYSAGMATQEWEPYTLDGVDTRTIYKLHGSLNWLYCPKCEMLDVTEMRKGALYIYESPELAVCPDPCCHNSYQPLIITPTFLKNYDEADKLREVWQLAEDALSSADEVVFAGYSLPDADVVLRAMFTRAIFQNRATNRSPIIRVVDYKNYQPKKLTAEKARYRRLFGKVDYDWTGFRKYVQSDCKTRSQRRREN